MSSAPTSPNTDAPSSQGLTLKLGTEGSQLRLFESGRPGYTALYTNPAGIVDMIVRLKASGAIVSRCHDSAGAVVRCGDTPFFTNVVKQNGSTFVKVTDVYGESCGQQEFLDEETGASDSGEADDDAANCECSIDSSNESSNDSCDEGGAIAQRDAFCSAVNDYLTNNGFTAIDCATLDGGDAEHDDKDNKVEDAAKVACHKIWQPAYQDVSAWLRGCKEQKTRATAWHEVVRNALLREGACDGSPIVLDLDGNGFSASTPEDGVRFDLLGSGPVQTAWISEGDALLALDRNGNGRIDGAAELFGNATRGARWDDGFAALAELDANGDGMLDARDAAYGELLVWRDADRDGQSRPSELVTLADAGVRVLYLSAARIGGEKMFDANRNRVPLLGGFERADGVKGAMADVFFRFKP